MRKRKTTPRGQNWIPQIIFTFICYECPKDFNAQDEKIRGEGVSLPNTPWRLKRIQCPAIKENGDGWRWYTAHNKGDEVAWELRQSKSVLNKALFETIISFLQINFNSHDSFPTPLVGYWVNKLLNNDGVINLGTNTIWSGETRYSRSSRRRATIITDL